ncbi:MAG: 50S ribosomal protein L17 [Candidatus Pacebacteria bacterium]|nr:50S ribosomal protein L17 [Candidatus Paceibacterota bacterium]
MKHTAHGRKFGRVRKVRVALIRSLARALILHGKIETTEAKAKEVQRFVEKLITLNKKGALASYRLTIARLGCDDRVAKKLKEEIAPKYAERAGGYTRITKLHTQSTHDARKMAVIEFV